jgi:trk system potassium uptake protein TrkA
VNIVILGAGQVGRTVAESLESEANNITLVDRHPESLTDIQDRLDVRTVIGHAAHPEVLARAGMEDADLVLAITNTDETNMVACQTARFVYNTPKCVARIRSMEYLDHPELFGEGAIPIDYLISPEHLVTTYIKNVIERPNVLQAVDFVEGRVQLVVVRANAGGTVTGRTLDCLNGRSRKPRAHVIAIFRGRNTLLPRDDTVVEPGDEVLVAVSRRHLSDTLSAFRRAGARSRRIMIAGGGRIGSRLAESLSGRYYVKLIERDGDRCMQIAESVDRGIVLRGDASDSDLLTEEGIRDIDFFCALTDNDETNIVACMLAKKLGAGNTLSIVNRSGYIDVAEKSAVDIVVSPAQVMIGAILTHIRRADVLAVHEFRRGKAEAIEISLRGDPDTSKLIGRRVDELSLPEGVVICVVARGNKLIFRVAETVLRADDRIVVFLSDKRLIGKVEELFQVGITFV